MERWIQGRASGCGQRFAKNKAEGPYSLFPPLPLPNGRTVAHLRMAVLSQTGEWRGHFPNELLNVWQVLDGDRASEISTSRTNGIFCDVNESTDDTLHWTQFHFGGMSP